MCQRLKRLSEEKFLDLLSPRIASLYDVENCDFSHHEFYYSYKETLGNFKVFLIIDPDGNIFSGVSKKSPYDRRNRTRGLSIAAIRALEAYFGEANYGRASKAQGTSQCSCDGDSE